MKSIIPYRSFPSHWFLGLFWGAALKKVPHVRRVIRKVSFADREYAGCMGSSHAGLDRDVVYALLDVG